MIILNITVAGFKQFAEPTTFEFHDGRNVIEGDNNAGKTTIAEAISYLLQGRDLTGSDKIDGLINDKQTGKKVVSVTGQIVDNNGQVYEIARSREISEKGTTTNKLFVNGEKYTQTKLDNILEVTDWRLFMAAMFPTWIHGVDDKVAAEVLRSLTKAPSADVVLASMVDEQRQILQAVPKIKLADPAGYQSELRKEIKANEAEIVRVRGRIEVYDRTIGQPIPPAPDGDLELVETRIAELKAMIAGSEHAQLINVEPLKQRLERLRRDYHNYKNQIRPIPPAPEYDDTAVCPTCHQTLGLDAFEKVLAAYEQNVMRIKAENEKVVQRINEITTEAAELKTQIENAEAQNLALLAGDTTKLDEWKSELSRLEAEAAQIRAQRSRRELIITQIEEAKNDKLKDLKLIAEMEKEIPIWKAQIDALGAYIEKREALTMQQIRQHLNRTSISLYKVIKETGELKPDFAITYDGQPYKTMSNSNRIRCGLEISALINAVTGWALPVYIDNAESITDFAKPAGQYFTASVKPGATLTIVPG